MSIVLAQKNVCMRIKECSGDIFNKANVAELLGYPKLENVANWEDGGSKALHFVCMYRFDSCVYCFCPKKCVYENQRMWWGCFQYSKSSRTIGISQIGKCSKLRGMEGVKLYFLCACIVLTLFLLLGWIIASPSSAIVSITISFLIVGWVYLLKYVVCWFYCCFMTDIEAEKARKCA